MPKTPDFSEALAITGGSRRKAAPPKPEGTGTPPSRQGTAPITLHFPMEVRDQLKILSIEKRRPVISLAAEAFNDLFAKYGKPEIAPDSAKGARADQ